MLKILDSVSSDDSLYRPLLWMIPEDSFRVPRQPEIARFLQDHSDWQVWLLDSGRSLGISHKAILADRGVPRDLETYQKLISPIFKDLAHYLNPDYNALNLNLPGDSFSVQVLLETAELAKDYCMHMSCHVQGDGDILARVFATRTLEEVGVSQLRDFLLDWFQHFGAVLIHGECLNCPTVKLERLVTPESETCYKRDGFQFILPAHTRLTWPWLELYLAARRTFPKRVRPSFQFLDASV